MIKRLLIYAVLCIFPVTGTAEELHVDRDKPNLVKFISDAKIETFEGVTSSIDGYLYWEGDSLTNKSKLYFEVDLNSIDTGIGLRNRHMRENYLNTDKWPYTKYTGRIIKSSLVEQAVWNVTTEGTMFIHGLEQPLSVTGRIEQVEAGSYRVTVNFTIRLSDYGIEIPSLMFLKIDENMELVLDFYLENVAVTEE